MSNLAAARTAYERARIRHKESAYTPDSETITLLLHSVEALVYAMETPSPEPNDVAREELIGEVLDAAEGFLDAVDRYPRETDTTSSDRVSNERVAAYNRLHKALEKARGRKS